MSKINFLKKKIIYKIIHLINLKLIILKKFQIKVINWYSHWCNNGIIKWYGFKEYKSRPLKRINGFSKISLL